MRLLIDFNKRVMAFCFDVRLHDFRFLLRAFGPRAWPISRHRSGLGTNGKSWAVEIVGVWNRQVARLIQVPLLGNSVLAVKAFLAEGT